MSCSSVIMGEGSEMCICIKEGRRELGCFIIVVGCYYASGVSWRISGHDVRDKKRVMKVNV